MAGGALGVGLQVGGMLASGLAQSSQLRQSAAVDDANAQRTLFQGAIEEQDLRSRERATSGEALAAEGGSGLQVGTGSAYDLLFQNALERERAVMATRFSAGTQADALATSAAQKRSAATSAMVGSLIGAGTQAIFGMQGVKDRAATSAAQAAWRTRQVPGGYSMPVPPTPAGAGLTSQGQVPPSMDGFGLFGSGKPVWNYAPGGAGMWGNS
jgi:hypothetical protein